MFLLVEAERHRLVIRVEDSMIRTFQDQQILLRGFCLGTQSQT